jgi:hypothetical protein
MLLSVLAVAQESKSYRIDEVTYDIKGMTRKYPLSQAVKISTKQVFPSRESLDAYVEDIRLQLSNQRVLQTVSIDTEIGDVDEAGITKVHLVVHTVDTWNIIALPYPKFDSNSGFQLKFKLKDYNFFGSMQQLNFDLIYSVDNNSKTDITSDVSFDIPFQFHGYAMEWTNDASISFPEGEIPEFELGTGLSVNIPVTSFAKFVISADQTLVINDRHDVTLADGTTETQLYEDDPAYLKEKLSVGFPITLWTSTMTGDLVWRPNTYVQQNFAPDGMHHEDLRGTTYGWGHALSIGRTNWYGNFRHGATLSLSNDYTYNQTTANVIKPSVSGTATAFYSFFDKFGLNSRLYAFDNLNGEVSDNVGDPIRGILNNRIDTDSAIALNLDLPIKVLDVDFDQVSGVAWTKYISFEMQISPFFDMMLTHDPVTGRRYSVNDGWYGSGMEILIFPKKMRSIFGRISVGLDLGDILKNGGYEGNASRDGEATKELFIGIGLAY